MIFIKMWEGDEEAKGLRLTVWSTDRNSERSQAFLELGEQPWTCGETTDKPYALQCRTQT